MSVFVEGGHHPLYGELCSIVGTNYCSDDDFVRLCYSRDPSPSPRQVQGIVVRPANTQEVAQIVKLANYTRTPIVPSGGRASLYGAPPGLIGKGIVVDMTRMRKVLNIDEANGVVTTEAGITLAELNTICNERGYEVHTAMQPIFSDTVGGQISGVMGGGTGMELASAGWNGRHITGLKVVLPNGDVLQTGAGPGSNVNQKTYFAREVGGPDITGLFMGDAGVFGIKVEATYRMYRRTKFRTGRIAWFENVEQAWNFTGDYGKVEPFPCYLMTMIPPTPTFIKMGAPNKYDVHCLFKANTQEELALKVAEFEEYVKKHGGWIQNDETAKARVHDAITGEKHQEMGMFGSIGYWTYLEVLVPWSQLKECWFWMKDWHQGTMDKSGVPYEWFIGITCVQGIQWIISSIIFVKGYDKKAMAIMNDVWREGIAKAVDTGYYPDANQGWASICTGKYWSPQMTDFMRSIKRTLDPNNIMNPGLWAL